MIWRLPPKPKFTIFEGFLPKCYKTRLDQGTRSSILFSPSFQNFVDVLAHSSRFFLAKAVNIKTKTQIEVSRKFGDSRQCAKHLLVLQKILTLIIVWEHCK